MCEKVLEEIPPIVKKYNFSDFDINKLIDNFTYWFKKKNLDNFPINTAEFIKKIS